MHIRTATPADAAALAAVEAACFPAAVGRQSVDAEDHLPGAVFVVEGGGFVHFIPELGLVGDHAVHKAHQRAVVLLQQPEVVRVMSQPVGDLLRRGGLRRRGCAGQVLERVIADARAQGRQGCVLTCKDKLVHYYEKFGFVNEGVSQSTHGGVVWYDMRLTF